MELRSVVVLHAQALPEETPDCQQKLKLVIHGQVLAHGTEDGKTSGYRTQSVICDDGVFHIMYRGST